MGQNSPPTAIFDLTGVTLGKYRLVEKLGQGGMAQVYKAYQPDLDRYVAVEVLHPHLTGDEGFAARFRREAKAIAALEHPNIVRVYDFDTDHGVAFLVMEHLEGVSLKSTLRDPDRRGERMALDADVAIASATLTLKVELWGDQSLPGAAVAYRILVPWDAATANYAAPSPCHSTSSRCPMRDTSRST